MKTQEQLPIGDPPVEKQPSPKNPKPVDDYAEQVRREAIEAVFGSKGYPKSGSLLA